MSPRLDSAALTEHEFEPVRGLPEELPPGEALLWQGAPDWRALALRALHLRGLALYFALLAGWRAAALLADGAPAADAAVGGLWLVLLALAPLAMLAAFAALAARTTVYSITSRRVVLRIGVALPVTINIPFGIVASAGLKLHGDGTGDIVLGLAPPNRIAYLMLWPHARPWRFRHPEAMLHGLPDAQAAAQVLSRALASAAQRPVVPVVADGPAASAGGAARPEAAAAA